MDLHSALPMLTILADNGSLQERPENIERGYPRRYYLDLLDSCILSNTGFISNTICQ